MAHGASMPWLKPHERGMLLAIERARSMGKCTLLVDQSDDKLVDTYYSYQSCQVIEAKRLVLDEVTGAKTHAEVMEQLRTQLVSAMRYGQTLYIRMADSACDFCGSYTDPAFFPLAVFDHEAVRALRHHSGALGTNLFGSDHPFAGVLRPTDVLDGVFHLRGTASGQRCRSKAREEGGDDASPDGGEEGGGEEEEEASREKADDGFEVVVCTQFGPCDFAQLLGDALPLSSMQPIAPQPSSVRVNYSHYKRDFALQVGGTLPFATIDEQYCISFVFEGNFSVALQPLDTTTAQPLPPPAGAPLRPTAEGGGGVVAAEGGGSKPGGKGKGTFRGLQGGAAFSLVVEEDAAAEAEARAADPGRSSYKAAAAPPPSQGSRAKPLGGRSDDGSTRAAELLQGELDSLDADEVRGRSQRYLELREARDLQDVVFGGS